MREFHFHSCPRRMPDHVVVIPKEDLVDDQADLQREESASGPVGDIELNLNKLAEEIYDEYFYVKCREERFGSQ